MEVKREQLYEKLPLDTPFSLHIFPIFACNFRCNYCIHSLTQEEKMKKNIDGNKMEFTLYQKAIDDLAAFNRPLKALVFAGHGEPLLHKDIAKMVAYAKEQQVAERVEIVTNGSLLTPKLADALIDAGLDRLRISLQGMTEAKYQEVADVAINFKEFVEQIRYFYQQKRHTQVYIKMIDIAFDSEDEQRQFQETFQPIADEVAIEYAIPFIPEIDENIVTYSGKRKQGGRHISNICSMPFYMLVLYPNGDIVPCCSVDIPLIYGNVREHSLKAIWDSHMVHHFLQCQLDGCDKLPVCCACSVPAYGLQEGDYLDDQRDALKKSYQTLMAKK